MGLAKMETSKNWLKIGIFSPAIGHFVSYFFIPLCRAAQPGRKKLMRCLKAFLCQVRAFIPILWLRKGPNSKKMVENAS